MLIRLLCLAAIFFFTGCANNSTPTVQRIGVDETTDLSGQWNDTDSKLVSTEMVQDMLSRPWLQNHLSENGNKRPSVIVGYIENLSHEHINVKTFIGDIERELINSGRIRFVADSTERLQLRDERADQDIFASEATRKAMGQELGADYMMIGTISTIIDSDDDQHVVYYQVDMKLASLTNNETLWLGQKKIKKLIQGRKSLY